MEHGLQKWLEMQSHFSKPFQGRAPGPLQLPSHSLPRLAAEAARFNPSAFSAPHPLPVNNPSGSSPDSVNR